MQSKETISSGAANRSQTSFELVEKRHWVLQSRSPLKVTRRIALFPIIFFQIYLATSVLTFAFGPWHWPVSNPIQLYSFLILAQLALLLGYLQAIKKEPRPASTKLRVSMMISVSLVLNYIWLPTMYKVRMGQAFSLSTGINAAVAGLTNPGQQYRNKEKLYILLTGRASTVMDYATLLIYPALSIAFPLGIVFWKRLSGRVRIALVGFIILNLLTWVASGTNKGIADFVMLLPCLLVTRQPALLAKFRPREMAVFGLIAIVGIIALFTFFSMGLLGRSGGKSVSQSDPGAGIEADLAIPIMRIVPSELQLPVAYFASYFTQGYYGLSLALKEPFIFCYGVGNSYYLEGLSRHLVSTPIYADTYPARIQASGWDSYGKWNSIYPWIASDLSFPGTIVFMFLLGRVFALVWLDAAFCGNLWAICLLPLLLTMLFYVPANNQVLAFPEGAMPFWALLFLWSLSRKGSGERRRAVLTS